MPVIDIVTMRGMTPRVAPHLLPDEVAETAVDCHFDSGVISPLNDDSLVGITLPFKPVTLFHYRAEHWFAWTKHVEAVHSPVSKDPFGRVYFTDGEYPKVTNSQIATGGANKPTAWYRLGVPAPSVPVGVASVNPPAGGKDDSVTDDETRFYVDTYVTAMGEEGPPGPASGKVLIPIPDSSVTLTLSPPTMQDSNITHRRIYRSVSGGGLSDYLLVAELPVATGSFVDSLSDEQLGPVLETYNYTMPPSDMRGICQMANGICAGFSGNTVLFSEPYLPYAWPEKYKLTTEHDIVAIAAIDTALIVMTKGYPYIMQGVSPASITSQKLSQLPQACVSARSVVAMDGVVYYASPDGLVGIGASGGAVITEAMITQSQWGKLGATTLRAWHHEGRYVAISDSAGFVFDPKSGDFRSITNRWDAAYADLSSDRLVIAKGSVLHHWRGAAEANVQFRWKSKPFVVSDGSAFSCCRVLTQEPSKVGVKVWVDGVQVLNMVPGNMPAGAFRLPALRGRVWQFEVCGTAPIARITLTTSMSEMT